MPCLQVWLLSLADFQELVGCHRRPAWLCTSVGSRVCLSYTQKPTCSLGLVVPPRAACRPRRRFPSVGVTVDDLLGPCGIPRALGASQGRGAILAVAGESSCAAVCSALQ